MSRNHSHEDVTLGLLGAAAAVLTVILTLAFGGPSRAGSGGFDTLHRGQTRTQVNHQLRDHGEKLWGYDDHGVRHRVRRYPTSRPHVYVVIDYRVRPHHLRLWSKAHCRWTPDGVDCWPGAR